MVAIHFFITAGLRTTQGLSQMLTQPQSLQDLQNNITLEAFMTPGLIQPLTQLFPLLTSAQQELLRLGPCLLALKEG